MGLLRFVIAAVAMTVSSGASDAAGSPEECSEINLQYRRLQCYDRLFPPAEAPTKRESRLPEPQEWGITASESPVDDSPEIRAVLLPKNVSGTRLGEDEGTLVLRCQDHRTSAYIVTRMYMVSDLVAVTVRIGEDPATTERWAISTDRRAAGLWDGSSAIPFIKSLPNHTKLFIRVQDKDRTDATFELGDVEDVAARIAAACNWP